MDEKFLEKTIQAWQPIAPIRLTAADGEEIIRNMVGLMKVLMKIHEREERCNGRCNNGTGETVSQPSVS